MNHHLRRARFIAQLMDSQFGFLGIRFGLDSLIGLIPGLGDIVGLGFSLYLLFVGWHLKVSHLILGKMILNVVIDTAIGAVPLVGDIGDLFFKANLKNLQLLETHFRRDGEASVIDGVEVVTR